MAGLELYEIKTEDEFKVVEPVLADGYSKPFNSFWELIQGDKGDVSTRMWQMHAATPESHWIGVRLADGSKQTIGVAEWILHESNPFAEEHPVPPIDWWSDECSKDISGQVFGQFFGRRPKLMSRPHMLLNICCVRQNFRRRGAGRMLMNWGREAADKKQVESFIEAAFDGVRLYESAGFTQVEPIVFDAKLPKSFENDRVTWLQTRDRYLPTPLGGMLMWRPKGGDWKEGDRYSWEKS